MATLADINESLLEQKETLTTIEERIEDQLDATIVDKDISESLLEKNKEMSKSLSSIKEVISSGKAVSSRLITAVQEAGPTADDASGRSRYSYKAFEKRDERPQWNYSYHPAYKAEMERIQRATSVGSNQDDKLLAGIKEGVDLSAVTMDQLKEEISSNTNGALGQIEELLKTVLIETRDSLDKMISSGNLLEAYSAFTSKRKRHRI